MTHTKRLMLAKTIFISLILFFINNVSVFGQTSNKTNDLHEALNNAKIEAVKQIIENDISLLESPNPRGSTPLMISATNGHTKLVMFFIKKGADINMANTYGNTALHYTAWNSNLEIFKLLTEKGANIKAENSRGQTPLHYSCMGGSFEIFKYCISKGMDINAKCDDGLSLVHWAAYGGNLEIFKFLESKGFDYNTKDTDGKSSIFWAASGNRMDIIKYLVDVKKVDVNIVDDKGICLLKSAVERGHYDAAKYFLDNGADINQKLDNNSNFLIMAAQNNNLELVNLLLDKGCKVNVFDDYGNTPLKVAASRGNFDVVKLLTEKGAKIEPGLCKRESCTNSGRNPLHSASRRYPNIVEFLVKKGIDVNSKDLDGDSPLHTTSWGDSTKCIEILCKNGADINIQNNNGETPLMRATKSHKPENIKTYLKYNADVSVADKWGKTPLHTAAIVGYGDVVDILIKNGADINAKDNKGRTPAYYAVYYGNKDIADSFFKLGASIENMPFIKSQLLESEVQESEASIWYLNHSGWAVKTKNHLLIFDYWQRSIEPDNVSINNGRINTEEIAKENIMVFASHIHSDHFSRDILDWNKSVKNIKYVLGFETTLTNDYTYIPPRENKVVDDVKITAISSTDSGEGFMVEVDGLVIYHPGDHANRYQEEDKEFSNEIDFLARQHNNIDIAFVPITGCSFRDKVALVKGNNYLVEKFKPSLVLPMHGSNNEIKYKEYADKRNDENNSSIYKYVLNKGDRIIYKKKDNKLGYTN